MRFKIQVSRRQFLFCLLTIFLLAQQIQPFNTLVSPNLQQSARSISTQDLNQSPDSVLTPLTNFKSTKPTDKLTPSLITYLQTGEFPGNNFRNKVILTSKSEIVNAPSFFPPVKIGENYLHFVENATEPLLRQLIMDPNITTIFPDTLVNDTNSIPTSQGSSLGLDSYQAKKILQTEDVWSTYGYTGKGVRIGVTDSGSDFGISDLQGAVILDSEAYTTNFDPTGTGLGLTSFTLSPITDQGKQYLPVQGESFNIWAGEQNQVVTSESFGLQINNIEMTDIPIKSISNTYKVGIMYEGALTSEISSQYFIFVLVDSTTAGIYDTIYVDFSTSLALSLVNAGIILASSLTYRLLADFSISDETPFGKSNPVPARDVNGDGVNDVSLGALCTVADLGLVTGKPIIRGIDPVGDGIGVMFDSIGHGALSASAIAGRGNTEYPIFDNRDTTKIENDSVYKLPGSAPGVQITATKGIGISDYLLGWFWTGGLSLSISNNQLVWTQKSNLLVDISSNSWGLGDIGYDNMLKGFDMVSTLLDFLSKPNSLYNGYPGLVFFVSAGNGAPGFGTAARPAMASTAITVGASTYYHFINGSTGSDDVAWFSGRGPSPYGSIKPDILTPGHTGFVPYPVIYGYGNGTRAASTFGGTSEAAPRAAGVAALLWEAMVNNSIIPNRENIKLLMASTAKDLGFHPTQQGAGLVNAFDAIRALLNEIPIVSSNYTSVSVGPRVEGAYQYQFGSGETHPLIDNPTDEFMVSVTPSQMQSGIQLNVHYFNGTVVNASEYSVKTSQSVKFLEKSGSISTSEKSFDQSIVDSLPQGWRTADFIEFSFTLTNESANALLSNGLVTPDLFLYDRGSGDIVADTYSFGTWSQLMYSGFPAQDFSGDPSIRFEDPGYAQNVPSWNGLTYLIHTRLFKADSWNGIDVSETDGAVLLNGTMPQEDQFGKIHISTANTDITMPLYIYHIKQSQITQSLDPVGEQLTSEQIYQQNSVVNTFDWGYRPESGDFNLYTISVPAEATYMAIYVEWSESGLIPDLWLYNSTGNLVSTSDVQYLGGGLYFSKTSECFRQNLVIPASDTKYYLEIHTAILPYKPGPFDLNVYTRYLTIPEIPKPVPTYSQNLNSNLTGNLQIDVSDYNVTQFPELHVNDISVQVYQGRIETYNQIVDNFYLDPSPTNFIEGLNSFDSYQIINMTKGEKAFLDLTWTGTKDVDMYVIPTTDQINKYNDKLSLLGATPGTNFESGIFDADKTGSYYVLIDYIDSPDVNIPDLNYTLTVDTRMGPTIGTTSATCADISNTINIPTNIFPNGDYGMYITYFTNYGLIFTSRIQGTFDNFSPFTFTVTSPTDGDTLSGQVSVSWSASDPVLVDISVLNNGVSQLVKSGIITNSFSFDSSIFPNGGSIIRVLATNGVYSKQVDISVTFNNNNPSQLPELKGTVNRNVPIMLSPVLIVLIIIPLLRKFKNNHYKFH